ncbi:MAG: hypothetical protein OER22_04720 [Gammaproteobacteria bacterium]|nr:hypothetical protein [Gammaproteobacteria bacterium]
MADNRNNIIINLTAVIVAVTDDMPRVLLVNQTGEQSDFRGLGLPSGPFDPIHHDSLENGLRGWVEAQTGLDLYYVEQLYTFGNRNRDPREIEGGPRVVSVAYIALTHEDKVGVADAEWRDWYSFLPWEDWRSGRPDVTRDTLEPALQRWARQPKDQRNRKQRQERVNVTFGQADASNLDLVLTLERYELLYEAGIVAEAQRDAAAAGRNRIAAVDATTDISTDATGLPLASDHRRILATALGRLRGKLTYRPVVFELLPGEFTLLQLQRVAEALGGVKLHKQNFRRLVTNADLVEPVGRTSAIGRGRPAELFRFRREVLGEKLTVGVSRPTMRGTA